MARSMRRKRTSGRGVRPQWRQATPVSAAAAAQPVAVETIGWRGAISMLNKDIASLKSLIFSATRQLCAKEAVRATVLALIDTQGQAGTHPNQQHGEERFAQDAANAGEVFEVPPADYEFSQLPGRVHG